MRISKPVLWCSAGLLIVAAGIWISMQKRKRHANQKETATDQPAAGDPFADDLLRDTATWLSKRLAQSAPEIEAELRKIISGGNQPHTGFLDGLQRIDYELVKDDATMVRRTVAVAFNGPDGIAVGKITRKYSWEDLPREFRSEFIHNSNRPRARNLFEKPH